MSTVRKFQKRKENFTCENCGHKMTGDGFTNHCSQCFFSKHVDIFPGDRFEACGGMMEPSAIEVAKGGRYIIVHKCQKCQETTKDKFRDGADNFDKFLQIVKVLNKKKQL